MEADKVKSKVKLIVSYWESIVGKKFDVIEKDLHTEEGMSEMIRTRNKMAMVIIFQGYWREIGLGIPAEPLFRSPRQKEAQKSSSAL